LPDFPQALITKDQEHPIQKVFRSSLL